jgi:thiol-disulfide isomerase/thioredoxin
MRSLILLLGLSVVSVPVRGVEIDQPDKQTPENQVKALQEEYERAFDAFAKAAREAKTPEARQAVSKLPGRNPGLFAPRFIKVAKEYPGTTASEDALIWIGSHCVADDALRQALALLSRDYARSDKLAPVFARQSTAGTLSKPVETLLRKALADNPQPAVQGLAAYYLGKILKGRAAAALAKDKLDTLPATALLAFDRQNGPGWKELLRSADPEALEREAELLFLRTVKEFGDFPHNDKRASNQGGTLRDVASAQLRELRELSLGKPAPEIEGTDVEGRPFHLSGYRGKVVVVEFGSHFFCGRCRDLYPVQKSLAKKYADQPFALVSVEVGREGDPLRNREALRKARVSEGLTWRCVWDGDWDGPINTAWNVRLFPTVYVLDRDGVIRHKGHMGEDLDKIVGQLLAAKTSSVP